MARGKLANARHEAFCQYIANNLNQTQAYIKAGYSKKGAKENACTLITKHNIRQRVDELQKKALDKIGMTREELLNRMAEIANGEPEKWGGTTVMRGVENLARPLGLFEVNPDSASKDIAEAPHVHIHIQETELSDKVMKKLEKAMGDD